MSTVESVESKSPPEVSSLAYVFDDASGNTIGFLEPRSCKKYIRDKMW